MSSPRRPLALSPRLSVALSLLALSLLRAQITSIPGNAFPPTVTITSGNIGSTATNGLLLSNPTAAAAGAQQHSPCLVYSGQGWKTNATAASQNVQWRQCLVPVQGAANPQARLDFGYAINGGAFSTTMSLLDGNVGIGTTSPTYTLHIAPTSGATAGQTMLVQDATATTGVTRLTIVPGDAQGSNTLLSAGPLFVDPTSGISNYRGYTSGASYGINWGDGTIGTVDTGIYRGAVNRIQINDGTLGHFADVQLRHILGGSVATYAPAPTIASGFGTSPSIAGTDLVGRVTVGTGGTAATGTITFGTAFTNAPGCTCNNETTLLYCQATASTTTVILTSATPFVAADKLIWNCFGY